MKIERILVVVFVVITIILLGIVIHMNNSSVNRRALVEQQFKALREKAEYDKQKITDQVKEIVHKDMNESFRIRFTEVIRAMQPKLDDVIATKIVKHILEESERHSLDPILMAALIWEESWFDPFARSKKNAVGLMQIRYSIWKKTPVMLKNGARKEGSLFWVDINIKVGTGIFKEYYDKAGHDIAKTLWRYNSGQTKFPKGKRAHEITYVSKVLIKAYEIKEALKNNKTK